MGPWGAIVMSFFGSVDLIWASWPYAVRPFAYAAALTAFISVVIAARQRLRDTSIIAMRPDERAQKIISWASIGEGVGIPVVAIVLANTGHADAVLCGIGLVVGLHFVPMAYAIPFPSVYALAGAILVTAAIGFALPQPMGSAVAGVGAAAALYIAAGVALRRSRPAKVFSIR